MSKTRKCTWSTKLHGACTADAEIPIKDKSGKAWAHLCSYHEARFNLAIKSGDAKKIIGAWASAGGPEHHADVANDIATGLRALARLARKLSK